MTQEKILQKIKEHENDMFGFISSGLVDFLTFENAKPYLHEKYIKKVEKGKEKWKPKPATKKQALKEIKDYMDFAWDKANNCRGLSAGRSLEHMRAWLFIAGDEELSDKIAEHTHYGKPQLRAICEKYDIDWKKYDDGDWRNDEMGPKVEPFKLT